MYKGNENLIPKNWHEMAAKDNKKTGFQAAAFYNNGKIVIAICGSNIISLKDIKNDVQMGLNRLPTQYTDAHEFYQEIKRDFPNNEIIFTGHSLGGSLAQLMGNETGCETVTFNAYGVGNLLKDNIKNIDNIRNYGNSQDLTFNKNIKNQIGKTYVINNNSSNDIFIGNNNKKINDYHSIENMGKLEDAVEYEPNMLTGQVSFNADFKEIDSNRVFTNEEIKAMSQKEFERLEKQIIKQAANGKVISQKEAEKLLKSGDLIWINSYTRSDGTKVEGYFRHVN